MAVMVAGFFSDDKGVAEDDLEDAGEGVGGGVDVKRQYVVLVEPGGIEATGERVVAQEELSHVPSMGECHDEGGVEDWRQRAAHAEPDDLKPEVLTKADVVGGEDPAGGSLQLLVSEHEGMLVGVGGDAVGQVRGGSAVGAHGGLGGSWP